jgi:hypothetical protein
MQQPYEVPAPPQQHFYLPAPPPRQRPSTAVIALLVFVAIVTAVNLLMTAYVYRVVSGVVSYLG